MDVSWRVCLPRTLIYLLVTAAVVLLNTPAGAVQ
jgi:NADH-quinone oxidoreductase subunit H